MGLFWCLVVHAINFFALKLCVMEFFLRFYGI